MSKMKERILKVLGNNHTTPCEFNNQITGVTAIYTYKKDIFCLFMGDDFPFDALEDNIQSKACEEIEKGKYKKNPSCIG